MKNHGGMIKAGDSCFVHESSLTILPAESSSNKARGTGLTKEIMSLVL
jgi:hypothetical protein